MGSTTDVRLKLSTQLETIRSKIAAGTLVLFVGEQASTLVSPNNPCPSLDDWWQCVNHSEVRHVSNFLLLPCQADPTVQRPRKRGVGGGEGYNEVEVRFGPKKIRRTQAGRSNSPTRDPK